MNRLAVVDLGSNSLRMGIYIKTLKGIKEIERYRNQVRLAQGLYEDDMLKQTPMEKTIEVFKDFRRILNKKGIKKEYALATECLRRAKNSDEFRKRVLKETGFDINIIDGETEACYGISAARLSVPELKNFYVLDTGGGSFELSKVENGEIVRSVCLPYGCVVLTEKFSPDIKGDGEMHLTVKNELANLKWIDSSYPVVTLGGSVKELASYTLKTGYDIDGKSILADIAKKTYEEIKQTPVSKRAEKFSMDKRRVDLITAGLCPLMCLLGLSGSQKIYFSLKGVRDGAAAQLLKDGYDK